MGEVGGRWAGRGGGRAGGGWQERTQQHRPRGANAHQARRPANSRLAAGTHLGICEVDTIVLQGWQRGAMVCVCRVGSLGHYMQHMLGAAATLQQAACALAVLRLPTTTRPASSFHTHLYIAEREGEEEEECEQAAKEHANLPVRIGGQRAHAAEGRSSALSVEPGKRVASTACRHGPSLSAPQRCSMRIPRIAMTNTDQKMHMQIAAEGSHGISHLQAQASQQLRARA